MVLWSRTGGRRSIHDQTGAWVIEPRLCEAHPFSGGIAYAVSILNREYIDTSGTPIWLG